MFNFLKSVMLSEANPESTQMASPSRSPIQETAYPETTEDFLKQQQLGQRLLQIAGLRKYQKGEQDREQEDLFARRAQRAKELANMTGPQLYKTMNDSATKKVNDILRYRHTEI